MVAAIELRRPSTELMVELTRWAHNKAFARAMNIPPSADAFVWYSRLLNRANSYYCSIFSDDTLIGYVGLENISKVSNSAVIVIAIGEPQYRRTGAGKTALLAFMSHISEIFRLGRVIAQIQTDNLASISFFSSAGFQRLAGPAQQNIVTYEWVF